jgi:uncharacterized membrane protein
MTPLIGLAVLVLGFAARLNPLAVVLAAGLSAGLGAGLAPLDVLAALGRAFNANRFVSALWIILPVIGLLEQAGLRERASTLIAGSARLTAGRLLLAYLAFRQLTAAIGLLSIAGHAQTIRPLIAPMAEAAARSQRAGLDAPGLDAPGLDAPGLDAAGLARIRAMAAATDNVGVFFGEDIFLAVASILLIKGVLDAAGHPVQPFELAAWAVPSALAAFLIHGARLLRLDHRLAQAPARPSVLQ